MIMRQKANSHNIWAHYKSLGQEIGLCHNSRVRTAPQLMISGSTQKHMDTPTHTHTNSDEKLYISFCVPPRLSLSLSLSRCSPSTHHPLSVTPHSRECPLLHHQILIFFSNQILLLKAFSCFLPKFHSKLQPTFLAPSKTSQANKQIDFFIIIIIVFFLLLLLHTHEIFFVY
jgi:hypothetical protein